MPIIRRLITSAQHKEKLRSELFRGSRIEPQWTISEPVHQSIGEAVLGNHVDVVEYLLKVNDIDAHLRYRNSRGENVLHLASRLCNPEMFRLLTLRFPEGIRQTDDRGETALERVIMNCSASRNRYESAKILLLQSGADRNCHSLSWKHSLLRVAVRLRDADMCSLLIHIGDINPLSASTQDSEGLAIWKTEALGKGRYAECFSGSIQYWTRAVEGKSSAVGLSNDGGCFSISGRAALSQSFRCFSKRLTSCGNTRPKELGLLRDVILRRIFYLVLPITVVQQASQTPHK